MFLNLRTNLIALIVLLLLVSCFCGGWLYRTSSQASSVVALKEMGAEVGYKKPEAFIEAYPFIKEKFSHDFYSNVEVITLPKNSEKFEGADQIIALIRGLPHLRVVRLYPSQEDMMAKFKAASPSVTFEIIKGDLATPSAGGR